MPFIPKKYQIQTDATQYLHPLEKQKTLVDLKVDVLFVGAGIAGLTGAIYLKQLCQKYLAKQNISIAVMDKARQIGGHALSGAIIQTNPFQKLFPNISELPFRQKVQKEKLFFLTRKNKFSLPLPPTMKNKNLYTASLCEVLRWMAKKAEALDIMLLPAFTAHKLLISDNKIKGVETFPTGLSKNHLKDSKEKNTFSVQAKITILADGSRGHLSQAWMQWKNISSKYPQTYALGVKELWEINHKYALEQQGKVMHTMGWPLPLNCFGGSWLYPMGDGLISLGLVAGLDSPLQNLDVHKKLQDLKTHPLFASILKDGRLIEWGAKTIPEGGYNSMPEKMHDHGLLIAGDAAGMVNVPALKGIHYAMTAGLLAADTILEALKLNNFSAQQLKTYTHKIRNDSLIKKELYPVRNVRQAFRKHFIIASLKSSLMFLTKGKFPGDISNIQPDANYNKSQNTVYLDPKSNASAISKPNAVYLSGNQTRDDIPSHIKANPAVPKKLQVFYSHLCPAGVYESKNGKLLIHASNCIDCKATDILGPRWTPKEGGTGPNYKKM